MTASPLALDHPTSGPTIVVPLPSHYNPAVRFVDPRGVPGTGPLPPHYRPTTVPLPSLDPCLTASPLARVPPPSHYRPDPLPSQSHYHPLANARAVLTPQFAVPLPSHYRPTTVPLPPERPPYPHVSAF